jgi:hypothetical protein
MTTSESEPAMTATPPETPAPAGRTGILTTVVRGLASTLGGPERWRNVAVGAAIEGRDVAGLMLGGLRWGAAQPGVRISRRVTATRAQVGRRLAEIAERGAIEQDRERQRAAEIVDAVITAVATSAVVNQVVDSQLDRVIRPLIQVVLDDILAALEREPERLQSLVRGQRDTMVDELVERIRSKAAAGDAAVDKATARMLRRDGRQMPVPPAAPR